MKINRIFSTLSFAVFLVSVFYSCSTSPVVHDMLVAGPDQTLIIVSRPEDPVGWMIDYRIFGDREQRLVVPDGKSGKIVVDNGPHTIYMQFDGSNDAVSDTLYFVAASNDLYFIAGHDGSSATLSRQ